MHFFPVAAAVLYLAAGVLYLLGILRRDRQGSPWGDRAQRLGFTFHSLTLCWFLYDHSLVFLANGGDYFFWFSWLLMLVYLCVGRKLSGLSFGALASLTAVLFMLSSSYLVHQQPELKLGHTGPVFFGVHVLPALVAELCLVLALVVSCVFLIQERRIKSKGGAGLLMQGPSLELLESYNHVLVLLGFIAMSGAIFSGCVWAWGRGQSLLVNDLRQWSALVSWLLLALILHFRMSLRWSARRVSQATVFVAGLLIGSFLLLLLFTGNVLHSGYELRLTDLYDFAAGDV